MSKRKFKDPLCPTCETAITDENAVMHHNCLPPPKPETPSEFRRSIPGGADSELAIKYAVESSMRTFEKRTFEVADEIRNKSLNEIFPKVKQKNEGSKHQCAVEKLERELAEMRDERDQALVDENELTQARKELAEAKAETLVESQKWKCALSTERARSTALVEALKQVWEFENCDSFQQETNEMVREALEKWGGK